MSATAVRPKLESLRTLPGDDVRQILWRFTDRYDLQMLVQSARSVARGPVARLVADGGRNSHEWTPRKNELLEAFDKSGITGAFMDLEHGGFIGGPKNLVLALIAFELAWVDGGAATASLAGDLALAPIHERGTPEQVEHYMKLACPPLPGEERKHWRGAFCLTEPIPYVGVDTGMLNGKLGHADGGAGVGAGRRSRLVRTGTLVRCGSMLRSCPERLPRPGPTSSSWLTRSGPAPRSPSSSTWAAATSSWRER